MERKYTKVTLKRGNQGICYKCDAELESEIRCGEMCGAMHTMVTLRKPMPRRKRQLQKLNRR